MTTGGRAVLADLHGDSPRTEADAETFDEM
jgi:hypothetical protein